MPSPIAPLDFSGIIPTQYSRQIIEEAVQTSAVLRLPATRVPMGTSIAQMPVPRALPKAAWTSAEHPRKPYTDLKLGLQELTAEEVAAVVAIPDAMIDDLDINIWAWVRPRLAEAIAVALDSAVLFGIDAPPTFPQGGVVADAVTTAPGIDAVDGVNIAMSAVETQGLAVTGHAADLSVKGLLRGVRDPSGALLLGTRQTDTSSIDTLYGLPIAYESFALPDPDFITGAWSNLIIGVRQDIRYEMNRAAVLADDEGRVVISGFQDNMTPLKVWARFACTIVNPVTQRTPAGARPFAVTSLAAAAPAPANGSGDSGAESAAAPASARTRKTPAGASA